MLSDTKPESKKKVRRRLFASDLTNEIDYLMDQQYRLDRERMLALWSFDIENSQLVDSSSTSSTAVTTSSSANIAISPSHNLDKSLTVSSPKTNSPLVQHQQLQQQSHSATLAKNSPNPLKKRPFVSSNKENLRPRIRDSDLKKWRRKLTF